ncbi:Uncharacterized protein Fot_09179 [Forsythia ovata]|uniref:Uncharacterized protein n=1 Tax=Forsythia ovata TaxID=205694 RepID=A0ABD1WD99_9LAMI
MAAVGLSDTPHSPSRWSRKKRNKDAQLSYRFRADFGRSLNLRKIDERVAIGIMAELITSGIIVNCDTVLQRNVLNEILFCDTEGVFLSAATHRNKTKQRFLSAATHRTSTTCAGDVIVDGEIWRRKLLMAA